MKLEIIIRTYDTGAPGATDIVEVRATTLAAFMLENNDAPELVEAVEGLEAGRSVRLHNRRGTLQIKRAD
jgi:hypothetical protein